MSQDMGWSRAGIGAALTINFLVMAFGSFAWGWASDRFGARMVTLCGAVLLGLALVLASRATTLLRFQLTFGLLVGVAASAFFAPMIATVTGWFERQRSLAVSLVSAGVGVAPMTISPLASWLMVHNDWRTAMLYIGCLAWVLLLPAALFVRRPPERPSAAPTAEDAGAAPAADLTLSQALTSPQFLILGFTFLLCCAAHSGPIIHAVSYAMWCGLGSMAAVSIYSVEGLGGLAGRLLLGLLGDRFGAKRVIIGGLAVQAVAIFCYLYVRELHQFYVVAFVFGTAYGGVMPLYAVLARDYFGQKIMGSVFGAATMLSSLGMSIGPVAGGWVYDRFGTYSWMYIASAAVGTMAILLGLFFPRGPARPKPAPALA
jgi:MFS family permease